MKTTLLSLIGSLVLSCNLFAQTPRLEIHHIGAGDGDATLIIAIDTVNAKDIKGNYFLDTAVILIDGQRSSGGKEVWRYIQDTLNALSPTLKRINYIVVSHLHIDHYGGIPYIVSKAKGAGWEIGSVIDRQFANYSDYKGADQILDSCYDSLKVINPDAASFKKYNDTLKKYNLYPTKTVSVAQNLLKPFNFKTIYMFCVTSYGKTASVKSYTDTCFLPSFVSGGIRYYTPKSENDLSIGFLLRFQGFNYLTLGDLGGLSSGNYVNGETPVTKGIMSGLKYPTTYHICANKVSHHGSEESTTNWFANTNNFTASVFTASLRSYGGSPHALPTQTAITNLINTGADTLLYTFIPNNPQIQSSYWEKNNLRYYNDVIIKLLGKPGYGNVNMVTIQRAKSKDGLYQGPAIGKTIICNKGHNW